MELSRGWEGGCGVRVWCFKCTSTGHVHVYMLVGLSSETSPNLCNYLYFLLIPLMECVSH